MLYYVIENTNGFEELVFQGTMEEAERERVRRISSLDSGATLEGERTWPRTKYYVLPETEWKMEIGVMH